jgi:hypothetical protein
MFAGLSGAVLAQSSVPLQRGVSVQLIDAVRTAGVDGLTLLTAQQDTADQGRQIVAPKGLPMRVVNPGP